MQEEKKTNNETMNVCTIVIVMASWTMYYLKVLAIPAWMGAALKVWMLQSDTMLLAALACLRLIVISYCTAYHQQVSR